MKQLGREGSLDCSTSVGRYMKRKDRIRIRIEEKQTVEEREKEKGGGRGKAEESEEKNRWGANVQREDPSTLRWES